MSWSYDGTLNVDVSPATISLERPTVTLEQVDWLPGYPPETFSFAPVVVRVTAGLFDAMVYRPHPETKPEHHQPPTIVEVLAPFVPDLGPGTLVELLLDPARFDVA